MTLTDKQFDRLKGQYNIDIPPISETVASFTFYARISLGTLYFSLNFWENQWYGTVRLGLEGELRTFTLIPNIVIFNNYEEYALVFVSEADHIALNGLGETELKVLLW